MGGTLSVKDCDMCGEDSVRRVTTKRDPASKHDYARVDLISRKAAAGLVPYLGRPQPLFSASSEVREPASHGVRGALLDKRTTD